MQEAYLPKRQQVIEISDDFTENSMRLTGQPGSAVHIIDVKSKSSGLVLSVNISRVQNITVKLISDNLPDRTYYNLSGSQLQMILQERYAPLADNLHLFAIIPFAMRGNLLLNDESYLQITITLDAPFDLKYDRIISAETATNPLVVKGLNDLDVEFESAQYDELFFYDEFADLRFHLNGQLVSLPQVMYKNMSAIQGFASQKLVPNTTYTLSQAVPFLLVEY